MLLATWLRRCARRRATLCRFGRDTGASTERAHWHATCVTARVMVWCYMCAIRCVVRAGDQGVVARPPRLGEAGAGEPGMRGEGFYPQGLAPFELSPAGGGV